MQVSSQAKTGNLAMFANPLQIGGDSSYGQYFKGTIDEVRIYNQELLPSEIVADMQKPVQRSVVAVYGFHETTGTTVTDASGNNTGTLSSGLTRSMQGKFGSALVFKGSRLVTIPTTATLNVSTSTPRSPPAEDMACRRTALSLNTCSLMAVTHVGRRMAGALKPVWTSIVCSKLVRCHRSEALLSASARRT